MKKIGALEILYARKCSSGSGRKLRGSGVRQVVLFRNWSHRCPQLLLFSQPACPVPSANFNVTALWGPSPEPGPPRNCPQQPRIQNNLSLSFSEEPSQPKIVSSIYLFSRYSNTCNSEGKQFKKSVWCLKIYHPPFQSAVIYLSFIRLQRWT